MTENAVSNEERIAVLETEQEASVRDRFLLHEDLKAQGKDLSDIKSDVHEIKVTMNRHVGFLRGVIFTFSTLAASIGAGIVAVWNKITGG